MWDAGNKRNEKARETRGRARYLGAKRGAGAGRSRLWAITNYAYLVPGTRYQVYITRDRSMHTQLANMSFDKVLDPTDVYFYFVIKCYTRRKAWWKT